MFRDTHLSAGGDECWGDWDTRRLVHSMKYYNYMYVSAFTQCKQVKAAHIVGISHRSRLGEGELLLLSPPSMIVRYLVNIDENKV